MVRLSHVIVLASVGVAASKSTRAKEEEHVDDRFITFSQCSELGYTVGEVPCSACKAVADVFGKTSSKVADCESCCTASLDWTSSTRYDVAVLKVRCVEPSHLPIAAVSLHVSSLTRFRWYVGLACFCSSPRRPPLSGAE
jgi:hypothetical protein